MEFCGYEKKQQKVFINFFNLDPENSRSFIIQPTGPPGVFPHFPGKKKCRGSSFGGCRPLDRKSPAGDLEVFFHCTKGSSGCNHIYIGCHMCNVELINKILHIHIVIHKFAIENT